MNFLKKLGLILVKGAEAAAQLAGFGPIIQLVTGFLPKGAQEYVTPVVNDVTLIAKEVIQAEKVFAAVSDPNAKTGSQKLAAVAPGVELILQNWLNSGVLGSTKIKDSAGFSAASSKIASGFADLLNSVGD